MANILSGGKKILFSVKVHIFQRMEELSEIKSPLLYSFIVKSKALKMVQISVPFPYNKLNVLILSFPLQNTIVISYEKLDIEIPSSG